MIGRGRPSRPDTACSLRLTIVMLPLCAPHPSPLAWSRPSRAAPARAEPRPVLVQACAPLLALVLVVFSPPVARAACAVEPSPVLVALVVVLACRHWGVCWWCSRAAARRRLPPRRLELTDPGLPYIAKHMFQLFQIFYRYVPIVLYGCRKSRS
jgi:protein-S-isoprenylcysteine O-methyltransferase Ste14